MIVICELLLSMCIIFLILFVVMVWFLVLMCRVLCLKMMVMIWLWLISLGDVIWCGCIGWFLVIMICNCWFIIWFRLLMLFCWLGFMWIFCGRIIMLVLSVWVVMMELVCVGGVDRVRSVRMICISVFVLWYLVFGWWWWWFLNLVYNCVVFW